ncbi:ATP synthase subunit d, mitochondrial-like [Pectinophora gossypiella]|uniref:ATP synthase subunit d, mitochondrial-like n=1 Tax=Pectinophora gossypiella TaxID=13191 RepID=UPI00214EDD55|nr:ATP synthase subunit d, mitochondrial-like [Pectinophora gossypiella]
MSRFTKPSINWVELEKLVAPDQKGKFFAFKAKSDAYFRRVESNPPEPPPIDWAEYKKIVPIPGLVDNFQTAYQAFKAPFPADTLTSQVDSQWAKLQEDIKKFVSEQQKEIDTATKEINRIKALPRFEDMTMETFFDMYPDVAIDPVNKPSFWPHNPEEQPDYKEPETKTKK